MPKSLNSKKQEDESPLLFYDGHCAMCNGIVLRLIKLDRHQKFRFASLQGQTARKVLSEHPELIEIDSILLVDRKQILSRSSAALRSVSLLGGPWRLVKVLYIIPKFLRDWVYDGIARVRYRWFGRFEVCPLPPEKWRSRFLP